MNLLASPPKKKMNTPRSTCLYIPLKLCVCVTRLLLLFSAFLLDGFVARPTREAGAGVEVEQGGVAVSCFRVGALL